MAKDLPNSKLFVLQRGRWSTFGSVQGVPASAIADWLGLSSHRHGGNSRRLLLFFGGGASCWKGYLSRELNNKKEGLRIPFVASSTFTRREGCV